MPAREISKISKQGCSTTKPGSLIKKKAPIERNQRDEILPEFVEADIVEYGSATPAGSFDILLCYEKTSGI